ncbi:hypothetical protein D918_09281 [Trichuris suis]|nr:hypothetical protein D918_09281 [Trichuris suis]
MALCGFTSSRLSVNHPDVCYTQDIRVQFGEQLKCLDGRTESHSALMAELQDFCRRRAEIELEYSKSLEKLHRQIAAKHKAEKQKRESWTNFAAYSMWKMFVEETKIESRNRSVMADLLTNHVAVKVAFLTDQMQRITKRYTLSVSESIQGERRCESCLNYAKH